MLMVSWKIIHCTKCIKRVTKCYKSALHRIFVPYINENSGSPETQSCMRVQGLSYSNPMPYTKYTKPTYISCNCRYLIHMPTHCLHFPWIKNLKDIIPSDAGVYEIPFILCYILFTYSSFSYLTRFVFNQMSTLWRKSTITCSVLLCFSCC